MPTTTSEQRRRRQLVVAKRRATALLAAVAVVFLASTIWRGSATWVGYVQATAIASLVGGLADWFAVTALFRHPLGLPIPHTAIVVERKDQFAVTLGEFIRESFLTRDVVLDRLRTAQLVPRLADWLAEPSNASRLAAEVADVAVGLADVLRDDEVHRGIEGVVRSRVEAVPLAPLAGRVLQFLTSEGRHQDVLDAALRGLEAYVGEHRKELADMAGKKSPWWLPGAVEDRIFARMLDGVRSVLQEMAADREHELRRRFDERLAQLAVDLQTSPVLLERGERIKHDLLGQPQLREWVATLWREVKVELRKQASDPGSELRRRLVAATVGAGHRLRDDRELAARAERGLEAVVGYVVDHFDGEIAALVSTTISRWDAAETATRLELLLGPDLQYVRINGTVVGGAAGLVLHALSRALS